MCNLGYLKPTRLKGFCFCFLNKIYFMHWLTYIYIYIKINKKVSLFSLKRPHWANSVIESPCIHDVCLSVCVIRCSLSRPLIGPEITWSVPGLLLVPPPSPFTPISEKKENLRHPTIKPVLVRGWIYSCFSNWAFHHYPNLKNIEGSKVYLGLGNLFD